MNSINHKPKVGFYSAQKIYGLWMQWFPSRNVWPSFQENYIFQFFLFLLFHELADEVGDVAYIFSGGQNPGDVDFSSKSPLKIKMAKEKYLQQNKTWAFTLHQYHNDRTVTSAQAVFVLSR